jgi:hypothetical protein
MKPSQLVATLRRIASNIERSKNPDRTLVARDLKKVVAALIETTVEGLVINSVTHNKNSNPMFPSWNISGTYNGQPYVYEVAVEMDGRDADTIHLSGEKIDEDVKGDVDYDWIMSIYETPEYQSMNSGN